MSWPRFVLTKEFWREPETPVYVSGAVFIMASLVVLSVASAGGPTWVMGAWFLTFMAFMVSLTLN